RNLRMRHSVRNQNLLALAVISDCSGVSDHQCDLVGWTSANHAQRCDITIRSNRKYRGGEVTHVRHPQFAVPGIQAETRRVLHARLWPLDDSCGRDIAAVGCSKDQDRIIRIVCDKYLAALFV